MSGLIDTSVFIDWQRGMPAALELMQRERAGGQLSIHVVVAAELLVGVRDRRELKAVEALIERESLVVPTEHDLRIALKIIVRHHLAHGIDWNDAVIAATCLRLEVPVLTKNVKHFETVRGLRVVRPY
jgi:predicted nucleic acid-binding protein